jgi:hypothetical protein
MSIVRGKQISSADFVTEVATADGIATSLALGNTPIGSGAVFVFVNGLAQTLTNDFTVSGSTISFTFTPAAASELMVKYIRK